MADNPSDKREKFNLSQEAGRGLQEFGRSELSTSRDQAASASNQPVRASYKRGGTVRATGLARLHKGEYVVPTKHARKVKKLMKRKGGRGM